MGASSTVTIAPSSDHLNSSPRPVNTALSSDEDRISALPDDILIKILERIDDLHAVFRTSTLSRRWAHLPHLLSCLLIQVADFLPRDKSSWTVHQVMAAYIAVLRRLLPSSPSCNRAIKRLRLSFYLTDPYPYLCSIGHAVGDVVEHGNTDSLEFTIFSDARNPSYEQCVVFGQRFMSFFQACPIAFRWLTSLTLQNITFGETDVFDLLNACNKLELLSLTACDSVVDPVTGEDAALAIHAPPHSALLTLEIKCCAFARIDLIRAPKLGRLVCTSWTEANPPLHFGDVPHLDDITLRLAAVHLQTPFALSHLLSNTSTLSVMHLDFSNQMIWIKPEAPKNLCSILNNLRDVYLYNIFSECDLNWTMFVLEAAPALTNFHLKLSRHPCERSRCEDTAKKVNVVWDNASPDFKHHRLSLLEIVGFAVDEKLTKYIRLVMERAVVLKRIRLLDREPCANKCDAMDGAQCPSSTRWRFPVEEEEKKLTRQRLIDGLSSSVEISIG
ncbi:unnamed protein product [Urochloa decumbens]|uniref:F-box domain-containing protein n=1 Tax=Urochloa decumbens TaxID=240449 RepID=A0ABC9FZA9_9POAL